MQALLEPYLLSPLAQIIVDYTIESEEIKQQKQRIKELLGPTWVSIKNPLVYRIYNDDNELLEDVTIDEVIDDIHLDNLNRVEKVVNQHRYYAGVEIHLAYCLGCNNRYFVGIKKHQENADRGLYYVSEPGGDYEQVDEAGNTVFLCTRCVPLYCGCSIKWLETKRERCQNCRTDKCKVHDFPTIYDIICKVCVQTTTYGKRLKALMANPVLAHRFHEAISYITDDSQWPV